MILYFASAALILVSPAQRASADGTFTVLQYVSSYGSKLPDYCNVEAVETFEAPRKFGSVIKKGERLMIRELVRATADCALPARRVLLGGFQLTIAAVRRGPKFRGDEQGLVRPFMNEWPSHPRNRPASTNEDSTVMKPAEAERNSNSVLHRAIFCWPDPQGWPLFRPGDGLQESNLCEEWLVPFILIEGKPMVRGRAFRLSRTFPYHPRLGDDPKWPELTEHAIPARASKMPVAASVAPALNSEELETTTCGVSDLDSDRAQLAGRRLVEWGKSLDVPIVYLKGKVPMVLEATENHRTCRVYRVLLRAFEDHLECSIQRPLQGPCTQAARGQRGAK